MDNSNTRKNLIKIAKLYYLGNLSQEQIAQIMGVSRPKISRMLAMAREQSIVEFKIRDFPMMAEEMAAKLKEHFGLSEVLIVPSGATSEQSKLNAGKAASEYFNGILRDDMQVGVAWGTTLDAMIRQFELSKKVSNVSVVQLTGGFPSKDFGLDSRELIRTFAHKLGGSYSVLQAPLVVSNANVRGVLLAEPEIRDHFARFNQLDAALIGLGSMLPEESVPYKAGYITLEQSQLLAGSGFATDVCGNRIFADGTIKPNLLSERLIAIEPERIKNVPIVIAIAVGQEKAGSIIAGAKGKFLNVLIIDEVAALTVMGMENIA